MIFIPTDLPGAYLIALEKQEDDRGFFARTWCTREFAERGLNPHLVQTNLSYNQRRGTLRGMHYQAPPHGEAKVVRVTRGAIFDVIIDLRPESTTYKRWIGVELRADNYLSLYIPEGFAHGFLTLEDHTEISYLMTEFFVAQATRGLRWDDPAFGITWPLPITVIAAKDQSWPAFG